MSSVVLYRGPFAGTEAVWNKGGPFTVERDGRILHSGYKSQEACIIAAARRDKKYWDEELSSTVYPVAGAVILGVTYAKNVTVKPLRISKDVAASLVERGLATYNPKV